MTNPMNIRARRTGNQATVRVLMRHDMESGQRKTDAGNIVPAWHITEVTVTHNGKPVLSADWGPAVSKNPYLEFTLNAAQVGDKIGVCWTDNHGESRSDDALVA